MTIIWHGHACYTLETDAGTVVLDPYEPGYVPGLSLPALTADMVLCSHGHKDHNCVQAVTLSGRDSRLHLETIPCWHDEAGGEKRGKNTIHVIEAEGMRIAHLGDLGHMLTPEQLAALGKIDVLLIPVGGCYTIDAQTAHQLADQVSASVSIPMHYRGEGFGYRVLGTVEDFLALRQNVIRHRSNRWEVQLPEQPQTLVLQCPTG